MFDRRASTLFLGVLVLAACGSGDDGPASVEDARTNISSALDLAEALRDEGAEVEELGEVITAVFSIPGKALRVNGEQVEVYRFPDEAAATAEVPRLTQSLIHWAAPARLYQQTRMLVLYAVNDPGIAALLEKLLGPPVATAG